MQYAPVPCSTLYVYVCERMQCQLVHCEVCMYSCAFVRYAFIHVYIRTSTQICMYEFVHYLCINASIGFSYVGLSCYVAACCAIDGYVSI